MLLLHNKWCVCPQGQEGVTLLAKCFMQRDKLLHVCELRVIMTDILGSGQLLHTKQYTNCFKVKTKKNLQSEFEQVIILTTNVFLYVSV